MNTDDIDIELPPLPAPPKVGFLNYVRYRKEIERYGRECMHVAIEAALQSQDREVAVPYDVVVNVANKLLGAEQYERFMGELDHARRGESKESK